MRILTTIGLYFLFSLVIVVIIYAFNLNVFGITSLLLCFVLGNFLYGLFQGARPKPIKLIYNCLELLSIIVIIYFLNVLLQGHGILAFIIICFLLAGWRMWKAREFMRKTINDSVQMLWGGKK